MGFAFKSSQHESGRDVLIQEVGSIDFSLGWLFRLEPEVAKVERIETRIRATEKRVSANPFTLRLPQQDRPERQQRGGDHPGLPISTWY